MKTHYLIAAAALLLAGAAAFWLTRPSGAPAEALARMDEMVAALNAGDADAVRALFPTRAQFLAVSDCDPPTVVDDVMGGADQARARAALGPAGLTLRRFGEGGTLLRVKAGEMPNNCRAKVDAEIFFSDYAWEQGGRVETGEAHLLRIEGRWYFVKL